MKKYLYSALLATGAAALTGCGNDAIVDSPAKGGDITVSVQTSETLSRAGIATIDGYELKCIMQLIDETGATVGEQKVMDAAGGNAQFVITGAEQEAGAVQALFWAGYQPTDNNASKIYNTDDLTDVSYATTSFDLSDAGLIQACDAFAGKISSLSNNASVTLTRPFAKISFAPVNPENAKGCDKLEVKYNAPAGYSVLSGNTSSKEPVCYTNDSFDPEATPWFVNYIFGAQNSSVLDEEISIDVTGSRNFNLTIAPGKIPTDPNYLVNVTGELGDAPVQDIDVNIGIDSDWTNDPDKPVEMKVGSYIDASGKAVAGIDNAVAVVFALGAIDGDDISAYPAEFAGKTIKGYAVALDNCGTRASFGEDLITSLAPATATNGLALDLMDNQAVAGTPIGLQWSAWKNANHNSGDNVTDWYVPSLGQLKYWLSMVMPSHTGDQATGSESFISLFPAANLFDRDPIATVNVLSASVNDQGNPSAIRLNVSGDSYNWQAAGIAVNSRASQSAVIRPMFTIFE
ncbi:MAG: hypothetical protein K2G24_05860 [Muribaculaceae bacterium]|nr:hypothetical protein [Muribaculaceae bacterium]